MPSLQVLRYIKDNNEFTWVAVFVLVIIIVYANKCMYLELGYEAFIS